MGKIHHDFFSMPRSLGEFCAVAGSKPSHAKTPEFI